MKKSLVTCFALLAMLLSACGKSSASTAPVIIEKKNQPDVEAFKAELAEEERAEEEKAAAEEAELHRDWVPVGGYSCLTTNHTFYVRVESVDLNAGTAQVYYQICENGKESDTGVTKSGATLKRMDNGNGNLEYEIIVNDDIKLYFKGYIRDRKTELIYKGTKLVMENHGNGK